MLSLECHKICTHSINHFSYTGVAGCDDLWMSASHLLCFHCHAMAHRHGHSRCDKAPCRRSRHSCPHTKPSPATRPLFLVSQLYFVSHRASGLPVPRNWRVVLSPLQLLPAFLSLRSRSEASHICSSGNMHSTVHSPCAHCFTQTNRRCFPARPPDHRGRRRGRVHLARQPCCRARS